MQIASVVIHNCELLAKLFRQKSSRLIQCEPHIKAKSLEELCGHSTLKTFQWRVFTGEAAFRKGARRRKDVQTLNNHCPKSEICDKKSSENPVSTFVADKLLAVHIVRIVCTMPLSGWQETSGGGLMSRTKIWPYVSRMVRTQCRRKVYREEFLVQNEREEKEHTGKNGVQEIGESRSGGHTIC